MSREAVFWNSRVRFFTWTAVWINLWDGEVRLLSENDSLLAWADHSLRQKKSHLKYEIKYNPPGGGGGAWPILTSVCWWLWFADCLEDIATWMSAWRLCLKFEPHQDASHVAEVEAPSEQNYHSLCASSVHLSTDRHHGTSSILSLRPSKLHLDIGYVPPTDTGSLCLAVDSTHTTVGLFRLLELTAR